MSIEDLVPHAGLVVVIFGIYERKFRNIVCGLKQRHTLPRKKTSIRRCCSKAYNT
jgi:hypothetical protein